MIFRLSQSINLSIYKRFLSHRYFVKILIEIKLKKLHEEINTLGLFKKFFSGKVKDKRIFFPNPLEKNLVIEIKKMLRGID